MAMSKKCFVFALLLIVAIVIGSVVFVAFKMQDHSKGDEKGIEEDDSEISSSKHKAVSLKKAQLMCESVRNGTEPSFGTYNNPGMYTGELGITSISLRLIKSYLGDTYQKCSYWLTGDAFVDKEMIAMIRADACGEKIPVIVISMRPSKGIKLSRKLEMWNNYRPEPLLSSWEEYDKRLNIYLKLLSPIPSIVILEPDLLMFTFDTHNLQYGWLNDKYKEEFFHRAQRVIKAMSRSWVYVDAGNANYLRVRENMENMAKSLLRLDGLRGFSINTAHFFNASYNNIMARRLHCLTGLHYITDTSRNGGPFSRQSVEGIQACYFDPPRMLAGLPPGWSWGTKLSPRQKRWIADFGSRPTQHQGNYQPRQTPAPTQKPIAMPPRPPPDQQQNPEEYNRWINEMRNNAANSQNGGTQLSPQQNSISQPQPNNYQPVNPPPQNQHQNSDGHYHNDLEIPSGRVAITAITAKPTRQTSRDVKLRSVQEALVIFRSKIQLRSRCLRREAVTVHDANVWIKTPGESDGRLYEHGTYHKCLLGHTKPCDEICRLITHSEQRSQSCGCHQSSNSVNNAIEISHQSTNNVDDIFFPNGNPQVQIPDQNAQNLQRNQPNQQPSLAELLAQGR